MWVDIWCMLDWIIGLCHKTAEMHFPGMSCSTSCKNINIRRPNIRRPNMVKRGLMYSKKNWKWMLARLWKNENIGSYVNFYEESNFCGGSPGSQLPCHPSIMCSKLLLFLYNYTGWGCCKVWSPKLVIKMEEKIKQKRGRCGVGDTMKWHEMWLNPGARGEHLTTQLTWLAAWLLVTHVFPVCLVEEGYF